MQVINILATAYIICLAAGCVFGRAMKFEKLIAKNHEKKLSESTTVSAPAFVPTRTTVSASAFVPTRTTVSASAFEGTRTTVSAPAFEATRVTIYAPAFDTKRTNLTRRDSFSLMFNETGTVKVPKKLFDAFTNMANMEE